MQGVGALDTFAQSELLMFTIAELGFRAHSQSHTSRDIGGSVDSLLFFPGDSSRRESSLLLGCSTVWHGGGASVSDCNTLTTPSCRVPALGA